MPRWGSLGPLTAKHGQIIELALAPPPKDQVAEMARLESCPSLLVGFDPEPPRAAFQPSHRLSDTVIDGSAVTHLTFLRPANVYPVKSRTDQGTDRKAVETDRELTARMA